MAETTVYFKKWLPDTPLILSGGNIAFHSLPGDIWGYYAATGGDIGRLRSTRIHNLQEIAKTEYDEFIAKKNSPRNLPRHPDGIQTAGYIRTLAQPAPVPSASPVVISPSDVLTETLETPPAPTPDPVVEAEVVKGVVPPVPKVKTAKRRKA